MEDLYIVNEIIKERMIKSLIEETGDVFGDFESRYEIFNKLYIANEHNDGCIHSDYTDDLQERLHDKLYSIYHAIRCEFNTMFYITLEIKTESYTKIILHTKNSIVCRDSMKTWNFTWNSIEDLQEYMFDIYSEIESNIEKQLTLDEIEILCDLANEYRIETCTGCSENCDNPNCTIILQKLGHMITALEAI